MTNVTHNYLLCIYFYTECPTRYRTRHENIATKFEQEYVRCVRNEEECVCSAPNCCDTEQQSASNILNSGKIIKETPGSVASGTHCTISIAAVPLSKQLFHAVSSHLKPKSILIVWTWCVVHKGPGFTNNRANNCSCGRNTNRTQVVVFCRQRTVVTTSCRNKSLCAWK